MLKIVHLNTSNLHESTAAILYTSVDTTKKTLTLMKIKIVYRSFLFSFLKISKTTGYYGIASLDALGKRTDLTDKNGCSRKTSKPGSPSFSTMYEAVRCFS